jgi:hypothetical protein
MREYRERKKVLPGGQWLKAERERVKRCRVPISEMDLKNREHVRKLNRIRQARFRGKTRNNQGEIQYHNEHEESDEHVPPTSENVVSSTSDMALTVKLPFHQQILVNTRKEFQEH